MNRRFASDSITSALAPLGFNRRGTRWYRSVGDVTDVVALTTSKSGDAVSVELGVFDPRPYQLVWPMPTTITEADCVVRKDLGYLAGVVGLWDPHNPNDVGLMVNLLEEHGLAWLDTMQPGPARIEELRSRALSPGETVLLALTEAFHGDPEPARSRLEELRVRVEGPWVTKIEKVLDGLDQVGSP